MEELESDEDESVVSSVVTFWSIAAPRMGLPSWIVNGALLLLSDSLVRQTTDDPLVLGLPQQYVAAFPDEKPTFVMEAPIEGVAFSA